MATPFAARALEGLFQRLRGEPAVLLAVSGGSDSMALMRLVWRWQRTGAGPFPRVLVATVDHGLRPGSAEEAAFVAAAARTLGFPHVTLTWQGQKPATGIQEAARRARYGLLARCAAEHGLSLVLTAHNEDDQAETLIMRLARGSGLDGLAGIPAETVLELAAGELSAGDGAGILRIHRPLLGIARARLRDWLAAEGVAWIEDPSNEDVRFERIRIRRHAGPLTELGLTSGALALSARRLARANAALEAATDAALAAAGRWHEAGYATLEGGGWVALAEEVRLRVLARLLDGVGGGGGERRLARLEGLTAALTRDLAEGRQPRARTLQGCMVEGGMERRLLVLREPGRRGLPVSGIAPGETTVWDGRFAVSLAPEAGTAMTVRAPSEREWAELRARGAADVPRRAALAAPAFWRGDAFLGAPALGLPGPGLSARFLPLQARPQGARPET